MNIISLVFTLAFVGKISHCWDQGLRDYILNIHNEMRKRPRACEMNKMIYDMELERQAERWAKRCVYRHEIVDGRGENLAFDSNKYDEKKHIDLATDGWYDEINQYRYGPQACGVACHYTQLVWSTTNKVGCYAYRCPHLTGGWHDSYYLVCFYTPKGNWIGTVPYKTSCPAKCAKGQTEENGLCLGKAIRECKDKNPKCATWAKINECDRNPSYMKKNCQKSCGACDKDAVSTSNAVSTSTGCEDSNSQCAEWASNEQCQRNPGYMEINCRKSCGVCGTDAASAECKDSSSQCAEWASGGECQKNPSYMKSNCQKSCKSCECEYRRKMKIMKICIHF